MTFISAGKFLRNRLRKRFRIKLWTPFLVKLYLSLKLKKTAKNNEK